MASFRRLLPLSSSIIHRTSFSSPGVLQGFRSYGAITAPEKTLLKLEDGETRGGADFVVDKDEIAKLSRECNALRETFIYIPEEFNEIPEMNPEGIYVNKNLSLDSVVDDGYDCDETLPHCWSEVQNLIYDLAKEHMVNEFQYPEVCMEFKYDPSFPIGGLSYDKSRGCLLKLELGQADACYYGRRKLSRKEIDEMYGTRHISIGCCDQGWLAFTDFGPCLVKLTDFFCFSEACLIADVVQYFLDAKLEFDACCIYQDVNRAIQHVHRTGLVHRGILSDPQKYLVKIDQVLQHQKMLGEKEKKLFLLLNPQIRAYCRWD